MSFMYKEITHFMLSATKMEIAENRKKQLQQLIAYLQQKINTKQKIRLQFICTHNSRRSILAQVWAQTLAFYFNIDMLFCYSGGTEETAVYPFIIKTLNETGFLIQQLSLGENPVYAIKFSKNEQPIIAFSKKTDAVFNPENKFAAIMTCSEAETACPIIKGAEKRIPLPYNDPKKYDDTLLQKEKYQERNRQIAGELFYVFSRLK